MRVSGSDYARLAEWAAPLTVFVGNRCYMRMDDGHCAALARDALGQYACQIYERRPEVCRALERGSSACEAERERKQEQARQGLRRLPLAPGCEPDDLAPEWHVDPLLVE